MDLYDHGCYFAQLVPVQALSNPLLRHSACAYAAKQLGRVQGRKAVVGGNVTNQAEMEVFSNPDTADWEYLAAKYYDKAIQLLMEELSNSRAQELSVTPIPEDTFTPQSTGQSPRSVPSAPANHRLGQPRPPNTSKSDETLAAVAILCVYEFLDNANTAWARHLSGTKSLFDMAENEGMMPVRSPTSPGSVSERVKPSRGRKAAFWNFARQDFLAACKFPILFILPFLRISITSQNMHS
jgi:Fungal specific transcription factor domain